MCPVVSVRPADFVDPNEAAWVEPDQQPEPVVKTEKSPSPSPEPSDEEEPMDGKSALRSDPAAMTAQLLW